MVFSITLSEYNIFLYCFYGKKTTNNYLAYADLLYESNWINLPNNLQCLYKLMIAYGQIPLSYHAGNIVKLNLETFLKVYSTNCTLNENQSIYF